jgi:hypothetical protein
LHGTGGGIFGVLAFSVARRMREFGILRQSLHGVPREWTRPSRCGRVTPT